MADPRWVEVSGCPDALANWQQTDPLNERLKFVAAAQSGHVSMTELCLRFGISRKTAYKHLGRCEPEALEALRDRSRAPHQHPNPGCDLDWPLWRYVLPRYLGGMA